MIVFFIILHVVAFYFQRVQVWYITKTSLLLFENRGRVKITPFIPRHKFKQRGEVLYIENYKTLMKRTEKNTNKWKDSPCLQIGRLSTVKRSVLPQRNRQIQHNPNHNSKGIFQRNRVNNPLIYTGQQQQQKKQNNQSNLENKIKARGQTHPDFNICHRATEITTVRHWHAMFHTDQGNRMGSPEINPHIWPIKFCHRSPECALGTRRPGSSPGAAQRPPRTRADR